MNSTKISILVPTRKRIKRLRLFLDSLLKATTFPGRIEVILGIDNDDIESQIFEFDKLTVKKTVAPRCGMGELNSRCLSEATGEIIILANDDVIVETKRWDEKVYDLHELYADKIYLGYFNDSLKGRKLCTFPILSKNTIDLLQTPFSNDYKGSLIDLELMEIFQRLKGLGRQRVHYLEDVIFKHEHFKKNPNLWDATYADRGRFSDDCAFYNNINVRIQKSNILYKSCNKTLKGETDMRSSSNISFVNFLAILLFDLNLPFFFKTHHAFNMSLRFFYKKFIVNS